MTDNRTQSAYDHIAPLYAERNAAMPAELAAYCAHFLEIAGSNAHILDVGCGAGRDMAWMEARGAQVTGIDFSHGMLAEARRRTHGPLMQMDMRHLDFPDDSFTGIWCTASLLHLPRRDAPCALSEMRRVLLPGNPLFLGLQEGAGECWEAVPYAPQYQRLFTRYRQDEADDLLRSAGFTIEECGHTSAGGRRWLQLLTRSTRSVGQTASPGRDGPN
jgi:ubiquinone/menaquinone biosynthesis C-methylase UbiE